MKKIFLAAILAISLSAGLSLQTKAQTKVVSIENFSTANDKNTDAGVAETTIYNKNGKLLYTVKRYNASALSKNISNIIDNAFENFSIIGVEEVIIPSDDKSIYFVHIGNNKKLATVKVYDNEFEFLDEYKRG